MTGAYSIRSAGEQDVSAMIELRAEAEQWMAGAGIRQWLPEYAAYGRRTLREVVQQGVAWVVTCDDEVAATVSLAGAEISDRAFWEQVADDLYQARYLGKMIVARKHAGQQLGDAILNWACQATAKAGIPWLRIDVRRDNFGLHAYYLDRGFEHIRTVQPRPGQTTESGWLAQRESSLTLDCPTALEMKACESLPASNPDTAYDSANV